MLRQLLKKRIPRSAKHDGKRFSKALSIKKYKSPLVTRILKIRDAIKKRQKI